MHRDPVVCRDGTSLSIQASHGHYSLPRSSDCSAYSHVEILHYGKKFPLRWYIQEDGIHKRVPANVVRKTILQHGGMVGGELPPLVDNIDFIQRIQERLQIIRFYFSVRIKETIRIWSR